MTQSDNASNTSWIILFICWLLAGTSTLGSLFFSEVMQLPPCILCWYQRIFLFPLVLVFTTGLFFPDKAVVRYALPLVAAGWLTAMYHNLLSAEIIPESIQPCSQGVSCTEDYLNLFGFLTIPMLSLLSFSAMLALLFIYNRRLSQ